MNWPVSNIGAVCIDTDTFNPENEPDKEFSYIDIASIDNQAKKILNPQVLLGKNAPSRARKKVRAGDILVATVRPNLNAVSLVPPDLDGQIASTGFCVLRSQPDLIDSRYLFYCTVSPDFINYLTARVTGANYPAVSDSVVKSVPITLPPLPIQKQITAILEKADAAREKRRQANQLTEQFLQSAFLEMFGDPARNPKGWEVMTMEVVCSKVADGTHFSPPLCEFGVPYITAKHLKPRGLDFFKSPTFISQEHHQEIYKRCDPVYGDVLYIKDGATTGIAAVNRYSFAFSMLSSLALLKPRKDLITGEYLATYLNNENVKNSILRHMAGAAIKRDCRFLPHLLRFSKNSPRWSRKSNPCAPSSASRSRSWSISSTASCNAPFAGSRNARRVRE